MTPYSQDDLKREMRRLQYRHRGVKGWYARLELLFMLTFDPEGYELSQAAWKALGE